MRKYFFIISFFLLPLLIFAQSETRVVVTLKGKIVNSVTNEAVAYTNIGIEETFYGTASDADGNFQLKIPEEMVAKRIFFSAIGYKSDSYQIESLTGKEYIVIKMQPLSYDIEDVDIEAQSRVLIRILRMASENTPFNYLGGPFNLSCDLISRRVINDTDTINNSAELFIYDRTGYAKPSKTDAFTGRKYEIVRDEPDYSFSSGIINLDELLETDWVRSSSSVLNPHISDKFNLSLESETEREGRPVWVIAFSQSQPSLAGSLDYHASFFEGNIIIAKDDYSVLNIEGEVKAPFQNRQGKSLAVNSSNINALNDVAYHFSVSYAKLVPQQITIHKRYNLEGKRVDEYSQLQTTKVFTSNVKEILSRNYFVK